MATRLTKAQLLARIDELESELGLRTKTIEQLQAEINAEMYRSRPSRSRSHDFASTVPVTPEARAVSFKDRCARARALAMKTGRCVALAH